MVGGGAEVRKGRFGTVAGEVGFYYLRCVVCLSSGTVLVREMRQLYLPLISPFGSKRVTMSDEEEKTSSKDSQILGPFVVKGMRLRIKDFSISMGDDGQLTLGQLTLHTSLDMSSYWLKIAYSHLLATEQAHKALLDAKQRNYPEDIGSALEQEFLSGMQAMMAAGVAVDAFYSRVKEHIEIPNEVTQAWHEKKTARYKQIAETLKIAFGLRTEVVSSLREVLKQNFDARNKAVHPSSEPAALTLYPRTESSDGLAI